MWAASQVIKPFAHFLEHPASMTHIIGAIYSGRSNSVNMICIWPGHVVQFLYNWMCAIIVT